MPILLVRLLNLGPRRHALILIGAVVTCVLVGGAVFAATQHLPVTTGWYWAVTTATTVGYGDVIPKNPAGRIVASVVMLTAIPLLAGAFAIITGSAVASGVRRLLEMGAKFPEGSYVLVLGTHRAVSVVLQELEDAGQAVVVIADVEPTSVTGHAYCIRADPTSLEGLSRGRPQGASRILIANQDDGDVLLTAVLVHQEAPGVPTTALVGSGRLVPVLKDLGIEQVLSPDDLTGHTIAKGMEAPHSGDLLMHLVRGENHRLVEHEVGADEAPRLLSTLHAERHELVLGVVHGSSVSLGVSDDPEVGPGDFLLLVEANGHHERRPHPHEANAGEVVAPGTH